MIHIQTLLILFLLYIHGSQQESKNNNKLWLNENKHQATSTNHHHQYLYMLNDTVTNYNDSLTEKQTSEDASWQPEDVLEASESRLYLNSVRGNSSFLNTSKASTSGKSNQNKKSPATKSTTKTNPQQTGGNSKSKNGKFFKNPSKLSISSLLTKSKRQDMLPDPKARKVVKPNRKFAIKDPRHIGLSSQSRSFHLNQPFLPYATGSHHLLFGSQLPLPEFYGHFATHHTGADMITGASLVPPQAPPTSTMHHALNAQFQTQQTMPQPFHQSVSPLANFRPSNELTPTIFFPAPAPPSKSQHQETANSTTSKSSFTHSSRNQQSNQQQKSKESASNSATNTTSHHPLSLPLGAAAAALFSERAKNFISHLNRGGLVGSNRKKENSKETKTSTPEAAKTNSLAPVTSASLMKAMPHDNVGLASMIKNAADTWAGASTSSEAAPSILVEHDGPTITTVNFDQHHNLNGPIPHHQRHTYDDDDDVNLYYESNEEEESEVGGSHDARRIVRYRGLANQQPHHQLTHHSPYLATHSLGTFRHLSQPRHVPYPPRYPHSRYPFEQQLQSHTIHTEVPYEPFSSSYGNGASLALDYGDKGRKKSYAGGGEFPQGALQDYLRHQRPLDQPQIYPDSINAIKEQNNGDFQMDKLADLTGNIGSKLSASNSDQIDLLIKELQELNKMKRNQTMDSSSSNGRDSSDTGNHRKLKLSTLDTSDYEDGLGGGGGAGGGGGGDDDEEEKLRVLRKKLLNRLRSKAKGGRRGNNNADDSFHSEAIKIPLHALLLAALDRRMSPSEAHSQSVVSTGGETGSGESTGGAEYQRKWPHPDSSSSSATGSGSLVNSLALGRQQDFNEITTGLGSLLTTLGEGGSGFADSASSSGQIMSSEGSSTTLSRNGFGHEFNKTPQLNQSADHQLSEYQATAIPHTPSMFILNNIRLPDQLSIEKGTNESALKSTIESSLELIRKAQNESSLDDQIFPNPTTRAPVIRDNGELAAGKKRRQVQQQDDYDGGKQMEEFTRDVRIDQLGIMPEWAKRKADKPDISKRGHREASSPSSVQFDDESEESTRNRLLRAKAMNARRRRKLSGAQERDAQAMNSEDAVDFLNKVQMDTELEPSSHVEDPIGLASQEELNKRESEKAVADELLSDSRSSSSDSDDNELEVEPDNRVGSTDRDDEAAAALWKPQVIDDEVSRLERLPATRRRVAKGDKANLNDYSGDQEDNQVFEEADAGKSGLELADTVMKVTIDSKDGSGARITQHFNGSKHSRAQPTMETETEARRRSAESKKG